MNWEGGAARAPLAGPGRRVRGLERRRQRGDDRARGGRRSLDAELVAEIDPEEFYDFQVTRPTIRLTEGQTREVDWPANDVFAARAPNAERDLVLLSRDRAEPALAHASPAPCSRSPSASTSRWWSRSARCSPTSPTPAPVPITGLASDPELVERLGLQRSSYEGPTGIVGIVHDACRRRGLTSASLWAAVPHYVAAVPNPKAALALLRRLEGFTGIAIEASELEEAMDRFETQVDRAVASNPEIEELVRRLEAEQDDAPELDAGRRPLRRHDRPRLPALPAPAHATTNVRLSLYASRGRADQPVVAPGADLVGGAGLEVLVLDPGGDLEHGALDPLGVVGLGRRSGPARRRARTSSCRGRPRSRQASRAPSR